MPAHEQLGNQSGVFREEVRITGSYETLDLGARVAYASIFARVAREAFKVMAGSKAAAADAGLVATEAITNGFKYDIGGVTELTVARTEAMGKAALEMSVVSPTALTEGTPTKDNMGMYGENETHGRGGLLIEGLTDGNWRQDNAASPSGGRELRTTASVRDEARHPRPNGHPPDSMDEAA